MHRVVRPRSWMCAFSLVVALSGCEAGPASPTGSAPPAELDSSDDARALLGDLRRRFETPDPSLAAALGAAAAPSPGLALLPPADATAFDVVGSKVRPRFAAAVERRADAVLAAGSRDFSTITALEPATGRAQMSLSFRLAGAARRAAVQADGYLAYGHALPGASLLSRVSPQGVEDYVYFERAPSAAEVRYDLELSSEVAGLRLVGRSLEALDASGTPLLRVAPPFLIDANRDRFDAELRLEGCAADTSPAGPWNRPVTAPGARRCTVIIAWDAAAARYPALLDPSWSTTGSMAAARANHTATWLSTGRILVVGGLGTGGTPIATCELYNPAGSGTWSATTSVPTTGTGRAFHTAVTLNDGTVFVAGGMRDATNATNTSAVYSPSAGTWTSKAQLVTARAKHAATVLTTGEVVVTGGLSGSTTIQSVEVYRPSPNNWFAATNDTGTRRLSHTSVLMQNGDVMILGGRDGSTTLASAESYNFSANHWTPRPSLSTARVGHTATKLNNGDILVTGGGPFNSTAVVASCELYKNATNAWRPTADMFSARSGHTATLVSPGASEFVVVAGGIGPGSAATAIKPAERFKPTWETWTDEPTLNTARANHTATLTSAGLLVAAGGITKTSSPTYLGSAEKVTPAAIVQTFTADYHDGVFATWPDPPQVNDPGDTSTVTELKGTMYFPTIGSGVFPIVVMMHGNHGSCGQTTGSPRNDDNNMYVTTGTCPSGYAEVRSDKGFAYVATELAQRGFIVFSIDANRGIGGASDNIDPRGRLVLKTLQHIRNWNTVSGASTNAGLPNLLGRLSLANVGLAGHSRGGQGVRAASRFYADIPAWQSAIPGLTIRGVFEIGSTDGTTNGPYDNGNIPWGLLIGTCDTNAEWVPGENAATGLRTFDRMIDNSVTFVGEYIVRGANHNYYNTEWQFSDVEFFDGASTGKTCSSPIYQIGGVNSGITGSARQRQTAVHSLVSFMLGTVPNSADPALLSVFDSATTAPAGVRISRARQTGEGNRVQLEDFSQPNDGPNQAPSMFDSSIHNTWSSGLDVTQASSGDMGQISATHEGLTTARVQWSSPSSNLVFDVKWATPGAGLDLTPYAYLEVRADRDSANPNASATSFGVKLLNGGSSNTVQVASYATLDGPPGINTLIHNADGSTTSFYSAQYPLGAIRIPLSAFGASLASVFGVEFVFNSGTSGIVYMTNVRVTP